MPRRGPAKPRARASRADEPASVGQNTSSVAHELGNANNLAMLGATVLSSVWVELRGTLAREASQRADEMVAGLPFPEAVDLVGALIEQIAGGTTRVDELVRSLAGPAGGDPALPLEPLAPGLGGVPET